MDRQPSEELALGDCCPKGVCGVGRERRPPCGWDTAGAWAGPKLFLEVEKMEQSIRILHVAAGSLGESHA